MQLTYGRNMPVLGDDVRSAQAMERTPFLDRIVFWTLDHPVPPTARYAISTTLLIAIAAVRVLLITSALPWLLFIPAILLIALAFGETLAIFGSFLSTLLAAFTIGNTSDPWFLTGPQWWGSILFLLIAIGLGRLGAELRASFRRARAANLESLEREAFLSSVLSSSTDCIKVINLDGQLSFMSDGGMKVMEVPQFSAVEGRPWLDFWKGAHHEVAREALDVARGGLPSHFVGQANTFAGNARWWDVSVSPIPGSDGKPSKILSVSRDSTALMEAQEKQRLLNGELGHRMKNVLALVQSIAGQTFRQAESVEAASAAFSARLAALGKATDVLTSTDWQSATMQDVVDGGLTSVDGLRDRVEVSGPNIRLDAQVALALTLALHELATNACKYGALSNENGRIALKWEHMSVENGGDGRFHFRWQESDGPPVAVPTRKGFGSKMIERSLRSYFRGETSLTYDPDGVIFEIDAPLPKAADEQGK